MNRYVKKDGVKQLGHASAKFGVHAPTVSSTTPTKAGPTIEEKKAEWGFAASA